MKIGFVWITGAVFLAALFTGCAPSSPEIRLTEKDGQAEVKTGQTFTINLEGNPTTGYTWEPAEMDEKLLAREGEAEFRSEKKNGEQVVGAGGVITLRFKALAPGSTTLKLVYLRPWEKSDPPLKTFEMAVTIK
jgi:inhibitor of cysteine peptidase